MPVVIGVEPPEQLSPKFLVETKSLPSQRIVIPLLNKKTSCFTDPAWYFDEGVFLDTIYDEDFAAFHRDSTDEYKSTLGIRTKCINVTDPPTTEVAAFAKACATKIKFVLNNFSAGDPPVLTYAALLNVSKKSEIVLITSFESLSNIDKLKEGSFELSLGSTREVLAANYKAINKTCIENPMVLFTLERFNSSLLRPEMFDRVVDITISMESLISGKDELRYRFSLHNSFVAASEAEAREDAFKLLQSLYDARSAIVHGDIDSKENKKAISKATEKWPDIVRLAKATINYYLLFLGEHKKNEWNEPSESNRDIGMLLIDEDLAIKSTTKSTSIAISRVDGNHRLHYADGSQPEFPKVNKSVSFCMTVGLTPEQEITLFRDINDNQMRMNTSHLDNIQARLTPKETLKREDPALYIARTLGTDSESPFYDRVYAGGKKPAGHDVPLRTLHTGINYMFSRPTKLTALRDADAQYKVIRNYFNAVRKWQPKGWSEPRKYIVLRGSGLWAICFIGADVIDRALAQGKFGAEDMLKILKSGREWDWTNKGDFQGYGGRGGAVKICTLVSSEFQDESGISMKALYRKIMGQR